MVRTAHFVLARILDDAVSDRMLVSNPAHGVPLPQAAAAAPRVPDRRPVRLLAPTSAEPYRSLVLLLGVGGLRWGEAIALRVCDIDFLRRRIELHRNAVCVGAVRRRLAEVATRTAPWWCRRS